MTITTVSIACDVGLPNNTEFVAARLDFTLSGPDYDTVSNDSIPAGLVSVSLNASGVGTANLWPVDRGTRNTHYIVTLIASFVANGRTQTQSFSLGVIQPAAAGGADLSNLLAQSSGGIVVGSAIYDTLADAVAAALEAAAAGADPIAAIAAKDAAEAAADAAALSAAQAALYDGPWLDSQADIETDTTISTDSDDPGYVPVGGYVRTRAEGFSYEVAASGATDQDITTAGGVKLYLRGLGLPWDAATYAEIRTTPEIPERTLDGLWTPAAAPYFNVIVSPDGPGDAASIWRSIFIGTGAGSRMIEGERCEAIGDGAMRFSSYGARNTAIGSIAMQWAGHVPNMGEDLEDVYHDLWTPTRPDNAAWNVDGMEEDNPGVRLLVAAPTFVTARTENEKNVAVGRDALLHLIRGNENTAVGYQAHTHAYEASNFNTAVGAFSLRNGLYSVGWTAIGQLSGARIQTGSNGVALGRSSAPVYRGGSRSVFIGFEAGGGVTLGDDNVMIGAYAGDGIAGGIDNALVIQAGAGRKPLISGSFGSGKVGVNVQPAEIKGAGLHVRTAEAAGTAPNASADDMVIEGSGNVGLSILSGPLDVGQFAFGRATSNAAGSIRYLHDLDRFQFRANATLNLSIGSNTIGFFGATPAVKPVGVAVTAEGIHAALVSLGLIAA